MFSIFAIVLLAMALAILLTALFQTTNQTNTMSTSTTTSLTSTSLTSTTTTTQFVCGFSCENQTWTFSSNLMAKWTFDNTYSDLLNTYNSSPSNSPSYVNGYVKQAILLNAALHQSLSTLNMPIWNSSFTIHAWLYVTGFPNSIDHSIVGLCPEPHPDYCLHLTIRKISSNYYLYFGFGYDDCQGQTALSASQWIHAGFVFDISSLTQMIYLDGILDNSRTSTSFIAYIPTTNRTTIGYIPGLVAVTGSNYFEGYLDQLTVSNRVLTDCEMLEIATLVAYFAFDAPSILADSGPNSLSALGSSYTMVTSGHSSEAISCNGSASSYLQASGFTALGKSNVPFSFSLWIRPRALSDTLMHVSSMSTGLGWCIPFIGFTSNGSLIAQIYNSNGLISVMGPSIPTSSSLWTHVVQTWSPTNGLRLYVNNNLVASKIASATTYTASTVPNYITLAGVVSGATCFHGLLNPAGPYNGDIDDFKVYSRELSADDVCTLYLN